MKYSAAFLACLAPAMAVINYAEPSGSGLKFDMFTTSAGSGTDMHFNISIPSSNGWGAIGIGDQMIGALMFIVLPDSTNGSTISVRTASQHVMPTPASGVDFSVISGNADNGLYTAQGVCRNCQTWKSFTFDPTSTSQSFVFAVGPGTSGVSGTGANARIQQHSNMGTFTANMVTAAQAPGSAAAASAASGSGSGITSSAVLKSPDMMMVVAHAVLLPLAFLFFFPLGIILLRVPGIGSVITHATSNTIGFILTVAGMGVAISMSMGTQFGKFDTAHQGIGLTATSLVILQWLLGIAHHLGYKKFQKRTAISYAHIVVGPIATVLGVINPILGFQLLDDRPSAIGVGVIGLLIWIGTFAFVWTLGATRRGGNETKTTKLETASNNTDERVMAERQ